MTHPPLLVVMGVSGSGKSTVGAALAQRLGVPFADADDLHPEANIAKMAAGEVLDDDDRYPWLETYRCLARRSRRQLGSHQLLRTQGRLPRPAAGPRAAGAVRPPRAAPRDVIARRQASRPGHFMPASLLDSQFDTLEPLGSSEDGLVIDVDQSVDAIVQQYVDHAPVPRPDATRPR